MPHKRRPIRRWLGGRLEDAYAGVAKQPFITGYMMALDDIQRTGLRPIREDTKREAAEHAFRRLQSG